MSHKWKPEFEKGVEAFRKTRYHDAVAYFTEAMNLGGNTSLIYESRAASFEKLGHISDALKDARNAIKLAPESPQGYTRSASLFVRLNKFDSAKTMLDLAFSRSKTPKQLENVERLRNVAVKAINAYRKARSAKAQCPVGLLPAEILAQIFTIATSRDYMTAMGESPYHPSSPMENTDNNTLVVSAVCHHWRVVAIGYEPLWRSITLKGAKPLRKLKIWTENSCLESSKQGVPCLIVTERASELPLHDVLTYWAESALLRSDKTTAYPSSLAIGFRSSSVRGFAQWLEGHQFPPSLQSLDIRTPQEPRDSALCQTQLFSKPTLPVTLEHLTLPWWPSSQAIQTHSRLITFRIDVTATPQPEDILSIFQSCTQLETFALEVSRVYAPRPLPDHWESIDCPSLHSLHLGGNLPVIVLAYLNTPSLRSLRIARQGKPFIAPLLLKWARDAPPLEELLFESSAVTSNELSILLPSLPRLRKFHYTHSHDDLRPLFSILTSTNAGSSVPFACPDLEHVSFTGCVKLKASMIRELVRSRLKRAGPGISAAPDEVAASGILSGTKEELSLRSIVMDGCPEVDPAVLPWLRKYVTVSCLYEAKAVVKRAEWKYIQV